MNNALDQFLISYSPEVRDLCLHLRVLVHKIAPGATEQLDAPSKLIAYSFGPKMADVLWTIMPVKSGVNLGIYRGVELPDPAHLLQGTGKVHRHVRINTEADLENPALKDLLRSALAAKQATRGANSTK